MINSRNIHDLMPEVAVLCQHFIDLCAAQGIEIIITSTYRDFESQTAIYNQGRTTPGHIVTNARAGESFHNYRVAFDFLPVINGKANWADIALFEKCGAIGKSLGLEYAGDWITFKEYAHLQQSGHTLAALKTLYPNGVTSMPA